MTDAGKLNIELIVILIILIQHVRNKRRLY
jgi:hypothetical protein